MVADRALIRARAAGEGVDTANWDTKAIDAFVKELVAAAANVKISAVGVAADGADIFTELSTAMVSLSESPAAAPPLSPLLAITGADLRCCIGCPCADGNSAVRDAVT